MSARSRNWARRLRWRRWKVIDLRRRDDQNKYGCGYDDQPRGVGRELPGGYGVTLTTFRTGHPEQPTQWRDARRPWGLDLEGWTSARPRHVRPDIHIERAFRTRAAADRYATFLAWCVDQLTDEQLRDLGAQMKGKLA